MDLRAALLAEHSKRQTERIVEYVGDDPEGFAELMQLFLGPVYRVSQRAAWAVSNCIERHPELVKPYYGKMLEQLEREMSSGCCSSSTFRSDTEDAFSMRVTHCSTIPSSRSRCGVSR